MFLKPDSLAVVADKKHDMYNRVGWVDECFPCSETGEVTCHWIDLKGREYVMPNYGQLIPFEDAVKGRIGNLIAGGDFHLAIGKVIYDTCIEGKTAMQVRPELQSLSPDQLKALAEQMFKTFSSY